MSCDYYRLPHPGIQSLKPYVPGKSIEELSREQGINDADIIKLASNENPLGCSPRVHQALTQLTPAQLAAYPSPANHPVQRKLSQKLGVSENMLTLGNGSDLLFSLILTTFALHSNRAMLTHDYAFISYRIQAQTLGIPVISIPLQSDWQVDIDPIVKASQDNIAVLFLANPNNPTGLFLEPEKIKHLLKQVPATTIVVLDEAYYEYAYAYEDKNSISLLAQYPNLIITRTFSKAYGLASLRLGYAIASPTITELLLRVQPPFAVNQAALDAANAALDDEEFIKQAIELNVKGMQQIKHGLERLKLDFLPSRGNFITFDCQTNSLPIYQELLKQGIIVRPLHPYGLPNHLRVTIGNPAQIEYFLDKLATCLSKIRNL
ncbi:MULTISPECIES: histidinol-phosphate transaminase [unclassified Legionella]|uniref:histidinol-phosphate transaminase n=1 Tax=unclassified Legionella TaxID=2622702 RepID=UPI0010566C89|nr:MULTISPECIES: histidinol-phosphate transaminase [unclassified Legionella]MDI9817602.1 histidinol-phosphate transaminase [Legionella sp. PL877]